MLFTDSLSVLQALKKIQIVHPLVIQIQDLLQNIVVEQREIVFMGVPGVGIRGNEAADIAGKEVLDKEPTDDLMPFSDLKPVTANYIHQVWQNEWDEAVIVSNKLDEIYQSFRTNCYYFVIQGKKTQF